MSISLTPNQEYFIQTKLQTGKYRTAEEVLEVALRLLEDVREKIDAAIALSHHTPPVDGDTFVSQILERFKHIRQAQ